jgi:hypothetical protein
MIIGAVCALPPRIDTHQAKVHRSHETRVSSSTLPYESPRSASFLKRALSRTARALLRRVLVRSLSFLASECQSRRCPRGAVEGKKVYKYHTTLRSNQIITPASNTSSNSSLHFQPTLHSLQGPSFKPQTTNQPSTCSSPSPPLLPSSPPARLLLRLSPLLPATPTSSTPFSPRRPLSSLKRRHLDATSLVRYSPHILTITFLTDNLYRVPRCLGSHGCLLRCCAR